MSGNLLTAKDLVNTCNELTFKLLKAEKALRQIEQFSDVGDDFDAVVRMKSIATDVLKEIKYVPK